MIDENNEFVLQLVTMSHCDSSPIKKISMSFVAEWVIG